MNHSITPLGVGGSGPGSTDFYKLTNQGSEYFSLSSGYKNLSASWQNQIVSVRTAAPTASYSTTLWNVLQLTDMEKVLFLNMLIGMVKLQT